MQKLFSQMPTTLTKADIIKAVEELPGDSFALEDIIEKLIVVHKVRVGLTQKEQGVAHDDVAEQFKKPCDQRNW